MALRREKKVYLNGEMPALFGKSSHTEREIRKQKRIWPAALGVTFVSVAILDSYTWPGEKADPDMPSIINAWEMNAKTWSEARANPLRYLGLKYTPRGREHILQAMRAPEALDDTQIIASNPEEPGQS